MSRALISADDVRSARRRRETRLLVPPHAIVTPLARDEAARWGIELVEGGEAASPDPGSGSRSRAAARPDHDPTCDAPPEDVERIVRRVMAKVPEADPGQVRTIARRLLDRLDR